MKFKELIEDVTWEEVRESLQKFYDDLDEVDLMNYQMVFEKLHNMEPEENDMKICVLWVKPLVEDDDEDEKEEGYWCVDGKDGTLQKETDDYEYFKDNCTEEFANSEVGYALDFTPWNKWLGMEIDKETANNIELMRSDIVALCLWEMSFIGFEEDEIQGKLNELKDRVDKVKNMSEEELRENSMSFDEFKERIQKMTDNMDVIGGNDEDFES